MSDSNLPNQNNEIKLDLFLNMPLSELLKFLNLSEIRINSDSSGVVRSVELKYFRKINDNMGSF